MTIVPTGTPPEVAATRIGTFKPPLQLSNTHHLCAGCGHPVAFRLLLEVMSELGLGRARSAPPATGGATR